MLKLQYNQNLKSEGTIISATYFHDNGAIQQQGTFNKKGKLDGLWVSYNDKWCKIISRVIMIKESKQGNGFSGLKIP